MLMLCESGLVWSGALYLLQINVDFGNIVACDLRHFQPNLI